MSSQKLAPNVVEAIELGKAIMARGALATAVQELTKRLDSGDPTIRQIAIEQIKHATEVAMRGCVAIDRAQINPGDTVTGSEISLRVKTVDPKLGHMVAEIEASGIRGIKGLQDGKSLTFDFKDGEWRSETLFQKSPNSAKFGLAITSGRLSEQHRPTIVIDLSRGSKA